jgi:hypothetical protein
MAGVLQHLRSSTLNKRPNPASMVDGQVAINYASGSPGAFFKDSNGNLVKVGPVHVGATAPNVSPASGGTAGNSLGEQWLDTSGGTYVFKIWDGSAWRSEAGEFVNTTGDTMTGALGIIAGSASTPGLFFSGDANSGLYSPGADQVAISTGGSGRLFVDSSGRIGVGVSSPGDIAAGYATLQIGGTNGGGVRVGTSSAVAGYMAGSASGVEIGTTGTTALNFFTNNQTRATITSAGLVGVGTSSPGFPIEIKLTGVDSTIWGYNVAQFSDATANNTGLRIGTNTSTAGLTQLIAATNSAASQFGFWTYNGSNWGERMRLDVSGQLGIGTTSPGQALHVVGSVGVNTGTAPSVNGSGLAIYDASFPRLTFRNSTTGDGAGDGTQLVQDGLDFSVGNTEAGSVRLFTANTERARIDSSGRLLVGTSSTSSNTTALLQGYGGVPTGGAHLRLAAGTSSPANGSNLGLVLFSDSEHTNCAFISADRDGGTWSGSSKPTRLVFSTTADGASSPTERMRIGNTGATNFFASTANVLGAGSNQAAGTTYYLFYGSNNASSTTTGATCFLVYTNGNVQNTNNSYAGISDAKLKENIVDAASQWSDIKALQVRKYNFKEGQTHTQIGLVAQEVELVSPGLVSESPDRDEEGNDLGTVTKSVNYSVLYMKAVKALQEAMERIETLEAKVAALESA